MANKTARRIAFDALNAYETGGVWSRDKLSAATARAGLDRRDAAFASYLCRGVLQNRMLLDAHIAARSSIRMNKLESKVLTALRLGAFQLFFADSVPASAAVGESVALVAHNPRAAGFVNAVLRKLAGVSDPFAIAKGRNADALSLRYSHPRWICEELIDALGPEEAEAVLAADNRQAPITFQVNTLRAGVDEVLALLAAELPDVRPHPFLSGCIEADSAPRLDRLSAYQQGLIWVQDAASMAAVRVLNPGPSDRILDACAAPGGKSFAAMLLSGGKASVSSRDLRADKLLLVAEGAERLGLSLDLMPQSALDVRPEDVGAFDKVICDLPCSGLGVIRKKPDIRYKDKASIDELPALQLGILDASSRLVRPDGTLLYSTCTWRRAENEDVVARFLEAHPDYAPVPFLSPFDGTEAAGGMLTLYPHTHQTDGFFICLMRRQDARAQLHAPRGARRAAPSRRPAPLSRRSGVSLADARRPEL